MTIGNSVLNYELIRYVTHENEKTKQSQQSI